VAGKSTKDKGAWIALGIASCALIAALVVVSRKPQPAPKPVADSKEQAADQEEKPLKDGYVGIGGVQRPVTDVRAKNEPAASTKSEFPEFPYGETPFVAEDANRYVKAVAEAMKTGDHPERLSSLVAATPFDAEAYANDPDSYLGVVEPGRVFAPAQPGPGVPRINHVRSGTIRMEQGSIVPLQVKVPAKTPVTFSSFDLGRFEETLLTSATVAANDDGIATVRFLATPGTIGDVDILAASPATSGQLRFRVYVSLPKPAIGFGSETVVPAGR